MRYITIEGGTPLRGEVAVQGAKNSVLPILAATLLSGDVCRIEGCPHLSDVDSAADILRYLGCAVQRALRRHRDDRAAGTPHLRAHGAHKVL